MVGWHIDDIKISHIDQVLVNSIVVLLENEFGKETPLTVTTGPIHEYLGMTIHFTMPGKVHFTMKDYVQGLIDECLQDLSKGPSTTPAANHLFQVPPKAPKLSANNSDLFHHLTGRLLYSKLNQTYKEPFLS